MEPMRSLLLGAFLLRLGVSAQVIRFDNGVPGQLPPGWITAMTHEGAPPRWQIVRDPSAPSPPYALAQLSQDRTAGRFPPGHLGRGRDSKRRGQRCVQDGGRR